MAFDASAFSKSTVVLVSGSDSIARSKAVSDLLRNAPADESETESFQGDAVEPGTWLGASLTIPLFAERRTIVVRNIARVDPGSVWDASIDKAHPAVRGLKEVPESTLILLIGDDEQGEDDKQRKYKSNLSAWSKLVTLAGGKSVNFDFDPSKTADLLREEATRNGKKLSRATAERLSLMVGGKPSLGLSELAKLLNYVGDAEEITDRDVSSTVIAEQEYNVFQLVSAIIESNPNQAIKQLRIMFGQTNDLLGQVLPRVFPVMLGDFRLIWQARFCLDSKVDPMAPSADLSSWLPSKRLSGEKDYRARKSIAAARRLGLHQIGQCIEVLVHTEAELKGQRANYSPGDTLEQMTLKMCQICRSSGQNVHRSYN